MQFAVNLIHKAMAFKPKPWTQLLMSASLLSIVFIAATQIQYTFTTEAAGVVLISSLLSLSSHMLKVQFYQNAGKRQVGTIGFGRSASVYFRSLLTSFAGGSLLGFATKVKRLSADYGVKLSFLMSVKERWIELGVLLHFALLCWVLSGDGITLVGILTSGIYILWWVFTLNRLQVLGVLASLIKQIWPSPNLNFLPAPLTPKSIFFSITATAMSGLMLVFSAFFLGVAANDLYIVVASRVASIVLSSSPIPAPQFAQREGFFFLLLLTFGLETSVLISLSGLLIFLSLLPLIIGALFEIQTAKKGF